MLCTARADEGDLLLVLGGLGEHTQLEHCCQGQGQCVGSAVRGRGRGNRQGQSYFPLT